MFIQNTSLEKSFLNSISLLPVISNTGKKIVRWAATTNLLRRPRNLVKDAVYYAIHVRKGPFFSINYVFHARSQFNPEAIKVIGLAREIKSETEMLLREVEALQLYMAVKQTAKLAGDIAEVGVFKGGSAKLICEAKGSRKLHLFDTFEGLPASSENDSKNQYHEKQYAASYESVKSYLQNYPNVYLYKGLFPSTAGPIENESFSFVHLDVDLYEATLACIEFFYPRMSKGGVIISHDYAYASGVRKAFDEFFADKPEPVIELEIMGTQCLVVKT